MIYLITILAAIVSIYLILMILIIVGFAKEKNKKSLASPDKFKKVSIIIPVRNEENKILDCLESIKSQEFEKNNFEVIVVNDHSIDDTENRITSFIKKNNLSISLYSSDKISKKEALAYGIKKAKHEIIATTDADCLLPKNWLSHISTQFENSTKMLLGPVIFKKKNGFLANFQTLDMMAIQGLEFGALFYGKPILNNAANLSYLKEEFDNVGGFDSFDTPSGDDVFLLEKFRSINSRIEGLLKKSYIVETIPELEFKGFFNQRLRWSSKAKYYSNNPLIFLSLIVLIQNISMIFIYLGIPLVEKYNIILTILLFCKWLIDFILLFLVASFFERKKALIYFIPVQVLYPVYIVVIWFVSMIAQFEWKGRKF